MKICCELYLQIDLLDFIFLVESLRKYFNFFFRILFYSFLTFHTQAITR